MQYMCELKVKMIVFSLGVPKITPISLLKPPSPLVQRKLVRGLPQWSVLILFKDMDAQKKGSSRWTPLSQFIRTCLNNGYKPI